MTTPAFDQAFLKENIRTIPDWPEPGVQFRDITTLFQNPEAWRYTLDVFAKRYQDAPINRIGALDARGFLIGSALAYQLNLPLILFRKKGKLPAATLSQEYQLEYGTATLEVHADAIETGENILLVDDLIATGGTLLAADKLIQLAGARTYEAAAIIDLPDLKGSEKLNGAGIKTFCLCEFEGE